MEINYEALGERIRKLRKLNNMTQEYVAEKLEVSIQHISNIENASKKPSLALLVDLAELLGVRLDDLLADTYPKERTGDVLYVETAMLLERCNAKERRIAMDMLESLVESLIRNRNRGKEMENETIE
ncbi:MAG TPA: helix-turn-helix domain-containing protein [Candidatus Anaerostipes excrementavium]|uniref:Helix-turn-helix domain-containing protein n=1 Tax=Candidatus Anaerostipes excrementavium TaxID=2838463 RepID=A0A9D2B888_9FIRM|nr:helix-turn-helix domain-containing protein [uncultured Anaerostipes sp.]HIX66583.1 helix-turn-helix domain-containing protein [Candidatus Anaerostipes excrementavium]